MPLLMDNLYSSINLNNSSLQSPGENAFPNRILWIDAAKAFALFCLIIGHTDLWPIVAKIDLLLLPIFWVAAGYTSSSSIRIKAKAAKLITPYIIMNALCLCFTLIVQKGSISPTSILGIIYSRVFIFTSQPDSHQIILMNLYNAPLWFLTSLLTAYILLAVILKAKTYKFQTFIVIGMIACSTLSQYLPILLPWSIDTAFFIAPLMWAGHVLRKLNALQKFSWKILIITAATYCLLSPCIGMTNFSIRDFGQLYPLAIIASAAGAVAFFEIFLLFKDAFLIRKLAVFNNQALYIFGLQLVFIFIGSYIASKTSLSSALTGLLQICLACIGGFFSGKCLNYFFSRLNYFLHK